MEKDSKAEDNVSPGDAGRSAWESRYREAALARKEDLWLEAWLPGLMERKGRRALDLGAGDGPDTGFLLGIGLEVTACDYAPEAVRLLATRHPRAEALVVDMRERLPWREGAFDLVLSDLSLHYFDRETTFRILGEIDRVLAPGGLFLARVNSIHDTKHGAGEGLEIEHHLFLQEGRTKRFFDEADIVEFFGMLFSFVARKEARSEAYGAEKALWELAMEKRG